MDKLRFDKLKSLVTALVISACILTTSVSFAYWVNIINGDQNVATNNNISIPSWNYLIDVPPEGVPEYNPNGVYQEGDLVWYTGVIYVIRHGGYHQTTPPGQPYGAFKDISMFYLPTNTYDSGEVVAYQGNFYQVTNGGIANDRAPIIGKGWTIFNFAILEYNPTFEIGRASCR